MADNIPRGMKGLFAVDMASFKDADGNKTTIDKVLRAEISDPTQAEVVDFDAATGTGAVKRLDATSDQVSTLTVVVDARKQLAGQPDEQVELPLTLQFTTLDADAASGALGFTSVVPA